MFIDSLYRYHHLVYTMHTNGFVTINWKNWSKYSPNSLDYYNNL